VTKADTNSTEQAVVLKEVAKYSLMSAMMTGK